MNEQELARVHAKEKMLEAMFEYAASCHVDNIISEHPISDDLASDYFPTPEFDRRMKKMFARHNRMKLLNHLRRKTVKSLPKVAIFIMVLLGSLTVAVASVDALRVKALNLIMDFRSQYTGIKIEKDNPSQNKDINQQIPLDWSWYFPMYTPKGFNVTKTEERSASKLIYYINDRGQTIRFTQFLSNDTDLRIDTEDATVQDIMIHNSKALLVEKQGLVSVVWQDEYLFYLIGETDQAEIIKMANSLTKNK